jgi:8-oxo-dGTP pyrophosphatase MutT (NUDIX family)
MNSIIRAATLCPYRQTKNGIEIFLTRRAFWNNLKNRPMRFPGEWTFAGGAEEPCDKNLAETAIREFREELGYTGSIFNVELLRRDAAERHNSEYCIEFYKAEIDENPMFNIADNGEVIDYCWITPAKAIELIYSDDFTKQQLNEFAKRGLHKDEYGVYAVKKRQIPSRNVLSIEMIKEG